MPKLVVSLPKYSLHKASGQAKVRFQNRDHYLGKYGTSVSTEAYERLIATLPKPVPAPEDKAIPKLAAGAILFVSELIRRFYHHAKAYFVWDDQPTGAHITLRAALRQLDREIGSKRHGEIHGRAVGRLVATATKAGIVLRGCLGSNESRTYWALAKSLTP
jgi:hypothetical protein